MTRTVSGVVVSTCMQCCVEHRPPPTTHRTGTTSRAVSGVAATESTTWRRERPLVFAVGSATAATQRLGCDCCSPCAAAAAAACLTVCRRMPVQASHLRRDLASVAIRAAEAAPARVSSAYSLSSCPVGHTRRCNIAAVRHCRVVLHAAIAGMCGWLGRSSSSSSSILHPHHPRARLRRRGTNIHAHMSVAWWTVRTHCSAVSQPCQL